MPGTPTSRSVPGIQLIVIATLWSLVLVFPFRRGERWAWWAMWTFPEWALAVAAMFLFVDLQPGVPIPPPAISGWVLFVLAGLLLLGTGRGQVRAWTD